MASKVEAPRSLDYSAAVPRRQAGLWLQLGSGYGILEVALWTSGTTQTYVSLILVAWILGVLLAQQRSASQLGIGISGLRSALPALLWGMIASGLLLFGGWLAGTLHPLPASTPPASHIAGYFFWALVQQFILQSFFYINLEQLLGARRAFWASVALFSLAHIPNPVLLPATFLGAMFFVAMFRRYRNLYPIAIAHGMLGLALAVTAPDLLLRHMRVGIAFLHFHA